MQLSVHQVPRRQHCLMETLGIDHVAQLKYGFATMWRGLAGPLRAVDACVADDARLCAGSSMCNCEANSYSRCI